jgi:hypothetical protein
MSAVSSQRRVCQRTEEERSALQAKIMDRKVIAERYVVRSNIMVPLLDSIYETIQTYYWGYLYTCACIVLTRLVRLFYANLEVVQDDDRGLVLQSRSSVTSSEYQFLSYRAVPTMKWCFHPLWTNCLPLIACWS